MTRRHRARLPRDLAIREPYVPETAAEEGARKLDAALGAVITEDDGWRVVSRVKQKNDPEAHKPKPSQRNGAALAAEVAATAAKAAVKVLSGAAPKVQPTPPTPPPPPHPSPSTEPDDVPMPDDGAEPAGEEVDEKPHPKSVERKKKTKKKRGLGRGLARVSKSTPASEPEPKPDPMAEPVTQIDPEPAAEKPRRKPPARLKPAAETRGRPGRGLDVRREKDVVVAEERVKRTDATPLLPVDLRRIVDRAPATKRWIRNRALILLGVSSGLRKRELVGIRLEGLQFVKRGLVVAVRGVSADVETFMIPTTGGRLCTVGAVARWIVASGIREGHVFRVVHEGGVVDGDPRRHLPASEVGKIVKRAARLAELDPKRYSGKSLRVSFSEAVRRAAETALRDVDSVRRNMGPHVAGR